VSNVTIRTYLAGDEEAQVAIYNAAAATLPRFKPTTLPEVLRRTRAAEFDPSTRLFAEENGNVVGYATFHANGRLSYPWCLPGHEQHADALFDAVLRAAQERGLAKAFVAYREDWPAVNQFFLRHGFVKARDMVNYRQLLGNMPTADVRPGKAITPVVPDDIPALLRLNPETLRVSTPAALHQYLFKNPYFPPEDVFVWRARAHSSPLAVGIMITNPAYANPDALDSNMPCFRLGAFGTEGMQVKRINGMFSFLAPAGQLLPAFGMDLLGYAASRVAARDDNTVFAAQVPSDASGLYAFYERNFERQGAFPVLERSLAAN
jgi:N-acetylglutamate synthase-like GNAT family acetyltransferase